MTSRAIFSLGELLNHCGAFSPTTPVEVKRYGYSSKNAPLVSIIVPVHNQDRIIATNLELMRSQSVEVHEIVVIVDGCTDDTSLRIESWIQSLSFDERTVGVTVATIEEGVFETVCDSIGGRLATGDFLIEVQADMSLTERGFDRVLLAALSSAPALLAVSGRGAHSFSRLESRRGRYQLVTLRKLARLLFASWARLFKKYAPSSLEMRLSDEMGRVAALINYPAARTDRRKVYVHETVMRGPLAIARIDFEMMEGFDTQHFFLGNDDHDLAMRALLMHQRRVGYTPIGFDSPVEVGSTRAPRSLEAQRRFDELREYYENEFASSVLGRNLGSFKRPKRYSVPIRKVRL